MSGVEAKRLGTTPTVSIVGDSLVNNGIPQYIQYMYADAGHNVQINAKSGSPISWGVSRLSAMTLTPIIVFALGTNETHDTLTVAEVKTRIQEVITTIGPTRKLLLFGVARKRGVLPAARDANFDIVNQAYAEVVEDTPPNVKWADWQSKIDNAYGNSFPWDPDGYHYVPPLGYKYRAQHMAARLATLQW